MTRQEFLDAYGEVFLTFSRYYKYSFTYTAIADDYTRIVVDIGGNADDIYKLEVFNSESITVKYASNLWYNIRVTNNKDVELFTESTY